MCGQITPPMVAQFYITFEEPWTRFLVQSIESYEWIALE